MAGRNKWIAGELPARAPRGRLPQKPSGAAVDRLLRANRKNLVGRPLAVALRSRMARECWRGAPFIAAAAGAALAGISLVAFWRPFSSLSFLGAGVLGLGAVLLSRRRPAPPVHDDLAAQLQREVQGFDAYLAGISPSLPPAALASLGRIKETLACVLSALAQGETEPVDLPGEDRFFAREMLSRYIPDACRHYVDATGPGLSLTADRSQDLGDSLVRQLDILHARLEKVLSGIAAAKAERLATHEAFIRSRQD